MKQPSNQATEGHRRQSVCFRLTGCDASVFRDFATFIGRHPHRQRWVSTRTLPCLFSVALFLGFCGAPSHAGPDIDKDLDKHVSDVLKKCQKFQPGSTRGDLYLIFTRRNVFSTAGHQTFVYRQCPLVKIDVDFTLPGSQQKPADEKGTDPVSAISRPYLESKSIPESLVHFVDPRFRSTDVDKNLTKQISEILKLCRGIVPGTTRAEVEKLFTTEGGFWVPMHQRYVYRRCPIIKVDIDFNRSDSKQSEIDPRPTDTVTNISRPYLEWSICD